MSKPRLVLIGNGMAGVRTVEELLKIKPDHYDITIFGAEPHPNYNRILLSPVLAGEMGIKDIILNELDWYAENNITLHTGKQVKTIDRVKRKVIADDGTEESYDRLLIATGSTPFMLPIPGNDLPGVIGYRDIKDTDEMIDAAARHKHAVVIGGGLLGLEAANGLKLRGIALHIGSQLTELEPYRQAYAKMADLTRALRADGHDIRRLDMGGGLGIPYRRDNNAPPLPIEYGQVIREAVGDLGCEIEIEPGRNISGNAGILLSSVIYLKEGEGRDFLILDAAMNDLIRPALYQAWMDVTAVRPRNTAGRAYDIVGPICETGDFFARDREIAAQAGDLLVIRSAGAYSASMGSAATARAMTERGPRAQLVEFAAVGHAPTLVTPDQVAVVSRFLLETA